jgi:hypothetical protein
MIKRRQFIAGARKRDGAAYGGAAQQQTLPVRTEYPAMKTPGRSSGADRVPSF